MPALGHQHWSGRNRPDHFA